ncbi:hypothetical protein C8J57DRAFT_3879 [Mycena rebaudengoi]|nr:hypothetical protein C8J57DRAFT_3879 [Mycena rebaudengoi]
MPATELPSTTDSAILITPQTPDSQHIRIGDILYSEPSTSSNLRRPTQTARKSTGGVRPRIPVIEQLVNPRSLVVLALNFFKPAKPSRPKHQTARKSTGAARPRQQSSDLGIWTPTAHKSGVRTTQTARKSTGGRAPRRQTDPLESRPPSPAQPFPPISIQDLAPPIFCGVCQATQPPLSLTEPPSTFKYITTSCGHHLHYSCYMVYISSLYNSWDRCPACQSSLLTGERLWVNATTREGHRAYMDMSADVDTRLRELRLAREQMFRQSTAVQDFHSAAALLAGPGAVDVNCASSPEGQTAMHLCAMYNIADGIRFLLSRGGDKNLRDHSGLLAIDYARVKCAWDSVEALT